MTYADLDAFIEELVLFAYMNDDLGIKASLRDIVLEYTPQDATFMTHE